MQLSKRIGSGAVIAGATILMLLVLVCLGGSAGWDATWRSFGVTPLSPHFFDAHVVLTTAACAANGFNPFERNSCNPIGSYDLPPAWLWLGHLGFDDTDTAWLAPLQIFAALTVMAVLLKGRSIAFGLAASLAIVSPSIMMGFERANVDLTIFALVGAAALTFQKRNAGRMVCATALVGLAFVLKLFPLFCVALAARVSRRTFLFAAAIGILAIVYLATIASYIPIIRQMAPTTFMLSYGYKALFLGLDHLRAESGLGPIGLVDTWLPLALVAGTISVAALVARSSHHHKNVFCVVTDSAAGTAFLFGAGIYCGTFLLGTNFIYRLMFLFLCLPQLHDWTSRAREQRTGTMIAGYGLFGLILAVLWLNGGANGHSTFRLMPHVLNWLLFFGLTSVLCTNLVNGMQRAVAAYPARHLPA